MAIAAGRLRNRIEIVRPVETDTGTGGSTTTWQSVARPWAEVIGMTGKEAVLEKVLQGIRVYRITLRHRRDITEDCQIRYGTEDLNIRSAVDPTGRREETVILADTDGALPTR